MKGRILPSSFKEKLVSIDRDIHRLVQLLVVLLVLMSFDSCDIESTTIYNWNLILYNENEFNCFDRYRTKKEDHFYLSHLNTKEMETSGSVISLNEVKAENGSIMTT